MESCLDNDSCSYLQDDSGDMQYSTSNPVRAEFHLSALHHGDDVLWAAELWFVVCVGVLNLRLFNQKRRVLHLAGKKKLSWTDRRRKSGRFEIKRFLVLSTLTTLRGSSPTIWRGKKSQNKNFDNLITTI